MRKLYDLDWAVMRSAGSGKNEIESPDVCAIKSGEIIGIECKAKNTRKLYVSDQQMKDGFEWAHRAGGSYYVGWKIHRLGWRFFTSSEMEVNQKSFAISIEGALQKGKTIESLFKK